MAENYAYYYAIIDLETRMCMEVQDTTDYADPELYPEYIAIPEYNEEYIEKYYINGAWYEDAEGTIPWSPN